MRARWVRTAVWLVAGLAVAPLTAAEAAPAGGAAPRPNLLLVTLDTVRADHLGLYGYGRHTSPVLDALGREAVVFDAAQATSSWTLPSLASIMTGVYPTTHGCDANESKLSEAASTLAEILRDAGYATAAIISHVFASRRHGMDQGFEQFDQSLAHERLSHRVVTSKWITLKAIGWLRQADGSPPPRPWFLWLHYFDPHFEYREHAGVSEQFGGERPVDLYDGELAFTDSHLGRVLAWLDEAGLDQRTVVSVVADHGEEFGEHGREKHRQHLYSEVLRVPLLIRAPGFEARRSSDLVSIIDLPPTLLELLGIEPPSPIEGRSLVPAMRGQPLEARPALAELRHSAGVERALIDGRWKFVRTPGGKRDQLFDEARDPGDRMDLAPEHPAELRELGARLEDAVERAERLRPEFGAGETFDLTDGEREALSALGYGTDP